MMEGDSAQLEKEGRYIEKEEDKIKIPDTEEPPMTSSPTKSPRVIEEEEPRPELKRVNSGVLQNSDYKKKAKQSPKFEKIKDKIESKKDSAALKFKDGQYGDSIKVYQTAAEILSEAIEDFPLWRKEIGNLEANIFNNIAFCF